MMKRLCVFVVFLAVIQPIGTDDSSGFEEWGKEYSYAIKMLNAYLCKGDHSWPTQLHDKALKGIFTIAVSIFCEGAAPNVSIISQSVTDIINTPHFDHPSFIECMTRAFEHVLERLFCCTDSKSVFKVIVKGVKYLFCDRGVQLKYNFLCNLFGQIETDEEFDAFFDRVAKPVCGSRDCTAKVAGSSVEGVEDGNDVISKVQGFLEEVLSRPKRQFDVHSMLGIFQTYVCQVNISPSHGLEKRELKKDVEPTIEDYISIFSVFGRPLCCLLKFIRQD